MLQISDKFLSISVRSHSFLRQMQADLVECLFTDIWHLFWVFLATSDFQSVWLFSCSIWLKISCVLLLLLTHDWYFLKTCSDRDCAFLALQDLVNTAVETAAVARQSMHYGVSCSWWRSVTVMSLFGSVRSTTNLCGIVKTWLQSHVVEFLRREKVLSGIHQTPTFHVVNLDGICSASTGSCVWAMVFSAWHWQFIVSPVLWATGHLSLLLFGHE